MIIRKLRSDFGGSGLGLVSSSFKLLRKCFIDVDDGESLVNVGS